jgi:cytochrome c oxidase subunit 3
VLTFILGLAFLGIKTIEYHEKWEKHHIPGFHYSLQSFLDPASDPSVQRYPGDKPLRPTWRAKTELYFFLYFAMTGMHALHMIIGIAILGFMIFRAKPALTPRATSHLLRTSACTGTLSTSSGSSCSRCST